MESRQNIGNKILTCDRVTDQSYVKEELKCRICLGILRNPQECKTCETCFCSDCLEEWLKETYKCPLKCSEEPKFRSKPHKIIRNMLSELKLHCINQANGCTSELQYDKIEDHQQNECEFEVQSCPGQSDGCNVQLIKKEMKEHEKVCQLVPIQCDFCKCMVKKSGIKAHWMYCEDAELSCEFCKGIFKKKNYLIHVNALCEEYQMNCGRCSGTFKRKYKEFHDCIRHLQNCQKTMGEDIQTLKEKIIEKDKKICELENRVFFELSDVKLMIQKLKESTQNELGYSHSRISSVHESQGFNNNTNQLEQIPRLPRWNDNDLHLFKLQDDQKSGQFDLDQISQTYNPSQQVFGYLYTDFPMVQANIVELFIQQNMTTSFIPMYYIIGAVSQKEIMQLKLVDTFDSIYYLLSPTCCFLPSFGKSFNDKMKFQLRKIRQINSEQNDQQETEIKLEIEELEKNQKQKIVILGSEVFIFFGVYCSQSTHLLNHKDITVKIL